MVKRILKKMAHAVGLDFHRYSESEWRWSYHVDDYYPADPTPRWGYGRAPHPLIHDILGERRADYAALIERFAQAADLLASIPSKPIENPAVPNWSNGWYRDFDAVALVAMLNTYKPSLYFEIGSGYSTKFARHTINRAGIATAITSLDPAPRSEIDALCDTVIRQPLESCDLSIFDELASGDILFFDGSHRVFTNSDATVFFLELLPRLAEGVIVHIHDIFLPWDYLPEWRRRMYSEQYLLAAMLLCREPNFRVLLPNFFVCADEQLQGSVRRLTEPLGCNAQGWSFWIEKR